MKGQPEGHIEVKKSWAGNLLGVQVIADDVPLHAGRLDPLEPEATDCFMAELRKAVEEKQLVGVNGEIEAIHELILNELARRPPDQDTSPDQKAEPSRRRQILWKSQDLGRIVDEVDSIFGKIKDPLLYERGEALVKIVRQKFVTEKREDGGEQSRDIDDDKPREPEQSIGYRHVSRPTRKAALKALISKLVVFLHPDGKKVKEGRVPNDVVNSLIDKGEWNDIRVLEGVTEIPLLRDNGSLVTKAGYDAETGYYLIGEIAFNIPENPTLEDAKRSAAFLMLELFHDFLFVEEVDRCAALAALFTLAIRPSLKPGRNECIPAFLCTAPVRGSGKTLLFKAIHLAVLGQMPYMTQPPSEKAEWRKLLFSLALEGSSCVAWDNVESGSSFGSPMLDMVITGAAIEDRILGISRMGRAKLSAVHLISGNNIRVKGDLARRVIPIRQDANMARPELRKDFRHPDLLAWVRHNHQRLVEATFTIFRAYALAGRPRPEDLARLGSFERWDDLVRALVIWLGYEDPCAAMAEVMEHADEGAETRLEQLQAFHDNFGTREVMSREVYATCVHGEAMAPVTGDDGRAALKSESRLFHAFKGEDFRKLRPQLIGKKLQGLLNHPTQDLVLRRRQDGSKNVYWWVEVFMEPQKGEPPF